MSGTGIDDNRYLKPQTTITDRTRSLSTCCNLPVRRPYTHKYKQEYSTRDIMITEYNRSTRYINKRLRASQRNV